MIFHPAHVDLPTPAAFGAVEADDRPLFTATGDIDCAFYLLGIPEELGDCFRLPAMRGKYIGLSAEEWYSPVLSVLPMGWSHAP